MNSTEHDGFRQLWGGRNLKRPEPTGDPYFAWFKENADALRRSGGLIEAENPFGAQTEQILQIGEFRLYRCTKTGYIFANPRLTPAAAKGFFDSFMGDYFKEVEATFEKRRELSYLDVGNRLREVMPPGAKLLEVGCGSGALMQVLREEFGFDVEGNEISSAARTYHERRKQKFHECAIEEMAGEGIFDGIFMWSVADHFADPIAAFSACQRLLKTGGILFTGNINIDGFDISTIGSDSLVFAPPGRVNFFNLRTLRQQIEMAGFTVDTQQTIGKLDVSIVRDYWRDGGTNGRNEFLTELIRSPENDEKSLAFQAFLVKHGLSGFQTVTAVKTLKHTRPCI